jgi:hypothetical protein
MSFWRAATLVHSKSEICIFARLRMMTPITVSAPRPGNGPPPSTGDSAPTGIAGTGSWATTSAWTRQPSATSRGAAGVISRWCLPRPAHSRSDCRTRTGRPGSGRRTPLTRSYRNGFPVSLGQDPLTRFHPVQGYLQSFQAPGNRGMERRRAGKQVGLWRLVPPSSQRLVSSCHRLAQGIGGGTSLVRPGPASEGVWLRTSLPPNPAGERYCVRGVGLAGGRRGPSATLEHLGRVGLAGGRSTAR